MKNPFNPSFGRVPKIYLDREQTVHQLEEDIQDVDSPYLTTLVYGMRGSGKTTLLTDVSHDIKKQPDWIVVDLTMGDALIPTLIELVYKQADSGLKSMLKQIDGISVSAAGLKIAYHRDQASVTNSPHQPLLESLAETLQQRRLKLLITIDEISSTPALREFAAIYQILLRNEYHIALLMAGLPSKVPELQNDDVLTFLLRSQRIYLEPLSLLTIKNSYRQAFTRGKRAIDEDTLNFITRITSGYAYAFQLLGFLLWRTKAAVIDHPTVDQVLLDYKAELFRNVYLKTYQELSRVDQEFVWAMAELGGNAVKTAAIGAKMGKPKNYISTYRRRLLGDQLINAPARGELSFTLPFFAEFVQEYHDLY
ncbi:MAG TPA: ATP-binding protein [Candidatus Limosilactobacillus intestinigallinarum]|jgi:hypothetical protein|nr:ATP-binding protein [Candidatus Limosilactobacillus intestinigallinarum]